MAWSGFDTLLKIGDGGSPEGFTVIAEVTGIGGPGLGQDAIATTHHVSDGGFNEAVGGLLDGGEVTFELNFGPKVWMHSAATGLVDDIETRTVRNFQLVFPDPQRTTWSFSALVTGFDPADSPDDKIAASVTLKVSGVPPTLSSVAAPFAFAATNRLGVFYSARNEFSLDGAGQPVWRTINDGLGSLGIMQFAVDPLAALDRQYCITNEDSSRGRVYRRVSGTWSAILTLAQANTLTGSSGGYLKWVTANQSVAGRVYVGFLSNLTTNGTWVLVSPDYGESWSAYQITSTLFNYGLGSFVARGDVVWCGINAAQAGGGGRLAVSQDNGQMWMLLSTLMGTSSWEPVVHLHPSAASVAYTSGVIGGGAATDPTLDLLKFSNYGASYTQPAGGTNIGYWIPQSQAHWISLLNTQVQRIVKNDMVYVTADDWAMATGNPATGKSVKVIVGDEVVGYFALGRILSTTAGDPHVVFATRDDGATLVGRAGNNANVIDTGGGDSIPYNCGGITKDGLYIGR